MKLRRWQFDPVVLIVGAAAIVLAGYWFGSRYGDPNRHYYSAELLAPYKAKYGTRVSQYGEEWLIRDFFGDRRGGVFVDVGANHYRKDSTTYTLETVLGWSGLAIDPQPQFAADYARYRPRTRYVQAFVSDTSGQTTLLVPEGAAGLASDNPAYVAATGLKARPMQVPTVTLDQVLEGAGLHSIDFLSMDIEHAEPRALAGFDIRRYAPELVCIEAHIGVRQQILDYFAEHGYVLVGKYWHVDLLNMYFMPLARGRALPASAPAATGARNP
jgi:FkbM family methyltransferase